MNYRCENDLATIKDYLQNAVVVAFDFETAPLLQYRDDPRAALDAHRACIVGISLSTSEGSAICQASVRRIRAGNPLPSAVR